jgi:hypothetical protein
MSGGVAYFGARVEECMVPGTAKAVAEVEVEVESDAPEAPAVELADVYDLLVPAESDLAVED